MKAERHWVRVYDDDLQRDYSEVWRDERALGTWVRLLSLADKTWPTPPELPRSIKPAPLKVLVDCGLVQVGADQCYRIRGLDTERIGRRNAASNAAAVRWQSESNAEAMPSRPEPSKDEQSRPDARDSLDRYHELTGYRPWGKPSGDWLHRLENDYRPETVVAALEAEWAVNPDRKNIIGNVEARLAKDVERTKREAKEKPRPLRPQTDPAEYERVRRELHEGKSA